MLFLKGGACNLTPKVERIKWEIGLEKNVFDKWQYVTHAMGKRLQKSSILNSQSFQPPPLAFSLYYKANSAATQ